MLIGTCRQSKAKIEWGGLNKKGERLIEICLKYSLRINNTFYEHKNTWTNSGWRSSLIDDVIKKKDTPHEYIECSYRILNQFGIDHGLVLGKITITLHKKNEDRLNIVSEQRD